MVCKSESSLGAEPAHGPVRISEDKQGIGVKVREKQASNLKPRAPIHGA